MREFHAVLLASYLVDGTYSKTCRHFAQVAELEANPRQRDTQVPILSREPTAPQRLVAAPLAPLLAPRMPMNQE